MFSTMLEILAIEVSIIPRILDILEIEVSNIPRILEMRVAGERLLWLSFPGLNYFWSLILEFGDVSNLRN